MQHLPKRIGFVGVGEQGWDNLLPALGLLPNANLVAVCDTSLSRRELAASTYGATAHSDFEQMVREERLDAVVVASHPSVHDAVLRLAIPMRIPTFIEKPPTLSTDSLRSLVALNRKYKTITSVGLNFGHTEPLQFVKAAVADPEFGELNYLRVTHLNNKPDDDLWFEGERMKSFLLSQVIHAVGVLYDFGTPADLDEAVDTYASDAGYLVSMRKRMLSKSGRTPFIAELVASSSSPYFDWSLQVISDRGTVINVNSLLEVEVYSHDQAHPFAISPKWWRSTWRPSPMSSGYRRTGYEDQFIHFLEAIDSGAQTDHSIESVLSIYEVMDRIETKEMSGGVRVA